MKRLGYFAVSDDFIKIGAPNPEIGALNDTPIRYTPGDRWETGRPTILLSVIVLPAAAVAHHPRPPVTRTHASVSILCTCMARPPVDLATLRIQFLQQPVRVAPRMCDPNRPPPGCRSTRTAQPTPLTCCTAVGVALAMRRKQAAAGTFAIARLSCPPCPHRHRRAYRDRYLALRDASLPVRTPPAPAMRRRACAPRGDTS